MRSRVDDAELRGCIERQANRVGMLVQTLGGTFAVPPGAPHMLVLDANGAARNVTLPANPRKGDYFYIFNPAAGAFALTIQDSSGAALSPAVTVAQGKAIWVVYIDATKGWKAMVGA